MHSFTVPPPKPCGGPVGESDDARGDRGEPVSRRPVEAGGERHRETVSGDDHSMGHAWYALREICDQPVDVGSCTAQLGHVFLLPRAQLDGDDSWVVVVPSSAGAVRPFFRPPRYRESIWRTSSGERRVDDTDGPVGSALLPGIDRSRRVKPVEVRSEAPASAGAGTKAGCQSGRPPGVVRPDPAGAKPGAAVSSGGGGPVGSSDPEPTRLGSPVKPSVGAERSATGWCGVSGAPTPPVVGLRFLGRSGRGVEGRERGVVRRGCEGSRRFGRRRREPGFQRCLGLGAGCRGERRERLGLGRDLGIGFGLRDRCHRLERRSRSLGSRGEGCVGFRFEILERRSQGFGVVDGDRFGDLDGFGVVDGDRSGASMGSGSSMATGSGISMGSGSSMATGSGISMGFGVVDGDRFGDLDGFGVVDGDRFGDLDGFGVVDGDRFGDLEGFGVSKGAGWSISVAPGRPTSSDGALSATANGAGRSRSGAGVAASGSSWETAAGGSSWSGPAGAVGARWDGSWSSTIVSASSCAGASENMGAAMPASSSTSATTLVEATVGSASGRRILGAALFGAGSSVSSGPPTRTASGRFTNSR